MTVMVSTSPMLHSTRSHPHSPLNLSPAGSPSLRPINPSKSSPAPSSGIATPLGPFPLPLPALGSGSGSGSGNRSYARQPTQRPYQSPLVARSGPRAVRAVEGDSLKFAELVVGIVETRSAQMRKGSCGATSGLGLEGLGKLQSVGRPALRESKSLAGSLAGSYEGEKAELIVDVPVWSPGCFQDLSTLHALRDTTLSYTHSLLAHLMKQHGIPASYRLLARSAITGGGGGGAGRGGRGGRGRPVHSGWGCIRLAPANLTPAAGPAELKPKIRRSSMDFSETEWNPFGSVGRASSSSGVGARLDDRGREPHRRGTTHPSPLEKLGMTIRGESPTPTPAGMKTPEMRLEEAIADDDEPADDDEVELKTGYRSGSVSDEEEEEDADTLVAREVEKRGAKEG